MTEELVALGQYSAAIAAAAVAGGSVPLFAHIHGRRTEFLLSFSAGVMLGAAFFHMLPEAIEGAGLRSLSVVMLGFLVLFILERYVLVHVCEEPEEGCEVHGAEGGTMGLAAFFGLSVHTLFDGIALGSSLASGLGALVFVAVVSHKVPSSLTLASILSHEKYPRPRIVMMVGVFALMVPAGALLYLALRSVVPVENFTPYSLAFSAGNFLYLALGDLLPTVHKRGGTRFGTVASLVVGMGAMWAVSRLHGH